MIRLHSGNSAIEALERELPEVADDKQCMFVDGVGMEQVILHAADDAAKCRDVQTKYTVQIHAAQFMGDAFRGPKNLQKQPLVSRRLTKLVVDQVQAAFDQPDRPGTDAANLRVLLQSRKTFQQGRRIFLEYVVAGRLQKSVANP